MSSFFYVSFWIRTCLISSIYELAAYYATITFEMGLSADLGMKTGENYSGEYGFPFSSDFELKGVMASGHSKLSSLTGVLGASEGWSSNYLNF